MVSPEYPPINGGVGRYTYNLVQEFKREGIDVYVACDNLGNGDFVGLSPSNTNNSEILLDLVDKIKPDIVHIQYEPGLYGLTLHSLRPNKIHTTIDLFYTKCRVPIVTTFHSDYTFRQWMRIPEMKTKNRKESVMISGKKTDNKKYSPILSSLKNTLYNFNIYWKYLINFEAFQDQNKEKLFRSDTGIVFSDYMKTIIGTKSSSNSGSKKVRLLYHGAEPATSVEEISRMEARTRFPSLPQKDNDRIALAFGFMTAAKGWDIIEKMKLSDNWTIVINSSVNHSTGEKIQLDKLVDAKGAYREHRIINLSQRYLSEEELSALFYASDVVLLPYRVTSGSGVMFDALGHGIPFVASDLPFFTEFAVRGLGIVAKRTPEAFADALLELDNNYEKYKKAINGFKENLKWNIVARDHIELYHDIIKSAKMPATVAISNNTSDLQNHFNV